MRSLISLLRVLMLTTALFVAQPVCGNPILIVGPSLEDAFEGSDVVPGLKRLLGPEYAMFRRNFDESATPVPLKDGSLLLDGWRLGFPGSHAAAVVVHPNGYLHAAYYNAEDRAVRFFSTSGETRHRVLLIWAKRFDLSPADKDDIDDHLQSNALPSTAEFPTASS